MNDFINSDNGFKESNFDLSKLTHDDLIELAKMLRVDLQGDIEIDNESVGENLKVSFYTNISHDKYLVRGY